jgi:peptidoglycan/LPS O-acetylase OafA/YrhL
MNYKSNKLLLKKWKVELARVLAIFTIIIGHMILYSSWIPMGSLWGWPIPVALGVFVYCAGYVQGLRNELDMNISLNVNKYKTFLLKRFIRLYLGYYIALLSIFIAQVISGTLPNFDPFNLFLDLTSLWTIFKPGGIGSIWSEGWFIGAVFILSMIYPFLRRIESKNRLFIYFIIVLITVIRLSLIFLLGPYIGSIYAYFTPYGWIAEYSIGMLIGIYYYKHKTFQRNTRKFQKVIVMMGDRSWALYLVHSISLVFISILAPIWEFFILFLIIMVLAEIYFRFLRVLQQRIFKLLKLNMPYYNQTNKKIVV